MGLLDKIKVMLNCGVKVEMPGFEPVVSRSGDRIVGRVILTATGHRKVNQMVYRFTQQITPKGNEADVRFTRLGELLVGPAFEMKKGETRTFDFAMPYSMEGVAVDPTGQLDTVAYHAKHSSPSANPRVTYRVTAVAQVDGALLSPGAEFDVAIVD